MATIEIGRKNFISGESQTEDIADRGFSPDSFGLNLTANRGKLHFTDIATDRGGSTITAAMIASCIDTAFLGNDAYYIDEEGAKYTYSGVTLTQQKASSAAYTYTLGTTDLIPFKSNFYYTTQTTIGTFDNDIGTDTEDWWPGLNGSYRHPMERVEDELFIADVNVIYFWNGTTSGTAFTLPTEVNVTSLRKHPDGRTLLAFTGSVADFSHTANNEGRVYYCDPLLRRWTREVQIEAQVEGTRVSGGVIYCTWGTQFGFFDGSGLQFLKELNTSTTTYSHNIDSLEDILIIRDGRFVKAFGNLGAGNVWWNIFRSALSNSIKNITSIGGNKLQISYNGTAGGDLVEMDYDDTGINGTFYSDLITFPSEVTIRKIEVLHDTTDNTGTTSFTILYRDPQGDENTIAAISYVNQNLSKTRINCNVTTDIFQLRIAPTSDDIGFKAIRITYDGTSRPI